MATIISIPLLFLAIIFPLHRKSRGAISGVHWTYGTAVTCIRNYDQSPTRYTPHHNSYTLTAFPEQVINSHSDSLPIANEKNARPRKKKTSTEYGWLPLARKQQLPQRKSTRANTTHQQYTSHGAPTYHYSSNLYRVYSSPTSPLLVLPTQKKKI